LSEPNSEPKRWFVAPYFLVSDVVSTAHFYRDTLGFTFDRFWGEPPSFCMVNRSGVTIMLAQIDDATLVRPNTVVSRDGGAWDAYIWVNNADALHAELLSKGAQIARGICNQPYGCRDFDVLDCNGYRLCFGQNIS
jgi:predicted enzyme related to lactoylglutathione lyase